MEERRSVGGNPDGRVLQGELIEKDFLLAGCCAVATDGRCHSQKEEINKGENSGSNILFV